MDPDTAATEARFTQPRSILVQIAALLLAPLAWAVHMAVSYALVPMVCQRGAGALALHLTSAIGLAIALLGLLLAWRTWRAAGRGWRATGHEAIDRARFLSVTGLLLGGYVTVILLLQAALSFGLDPCEGLR
jgi:hypothetical protein